MNLFGEALEKALLAHGVGKTEFADACGLHRNQLTNITSGRAANPNKIGEIFAALAGLLPDDARRGLAIAFLEDRRSDLGFDSSLITITTVDGKEVNVNRARLLELYDTDPECRAAIDSVVDIMLPRRQFSPKTAYGEPADRAAHGAGQAAET
jgi:transcriptional regulator with XRE-family HTH domain